MKTINHATTAVANKTSSEPTTVAYETSTDLCDSLLEELSRGSVTDPEAKALITAVLSTLTALTFFLNLAVLASLTLGRGRPCNPGASVILTVSLVTGDLLLSVSVMPLSVYVTMGDSWALGQAACRVFTASDIFLCTVSILHLTGLAVDRYLAIVHPFLYLTITTTHARGFCAALWGLALFISLPVLVPQWHVHNEPAALCLLDLYYTGRACVWPLGTAYQSWALPIAILLPLLLIVGLHGPIYRVSKAQATRIQAMPAPRFPAEHRAASTEGLMSLSAVPGAAAAAAAACTGGRRTRFPGVPATVSTEEPTQSSAIFRAASDESTDGSFGCREENTAVDVNRREDDENTAVDVNRREDGEKPEPQEDPRERGDREGQSGNARENRKEEEDRSTEQTSGRKDERGSSRNPQRAANSAEEEEKKKEKKKKKTVATGRRAESKAVKTVLCLVLCFVLCWSPLLTALMVQTVMDHRNPPSVVVTAFTWLSYANSFINPLLLYRFNHAVRQAVRRFLGLQTDRHVAP